MKTNFKASATMLLAVIFFLTAILAAVVIYIYNSQAVKPDFPAMPGQNAVETKNNPSAAAPAAVDETAGWQTYRNESYGFELKYPPVWDVSDGSPLAINDPAVGFIQIKISNGARGREDESQSPCSPGIAVIVGQIGKERVDGTGKTHNDLSFTDFVSYVIKNPERGIAPASMPELNPAIFGGLPALEVSAKIDNCDSAIYYIDQGAHAYGTIFTIADKKENKEIINKIISTFKFIESPKSGSLEKLLLFITDNGFHIYDPLLQKNVISGEIPLPGKGFTVREAAFSPKTKEIIYRASDCSDMGTPDCSSDMYRMDTGGKSAPTVIPQYEEKDYYLGNWTFDAANNLVIFNYWRQSGANKQIIKKVKAESGELVFSKEYQRRGNIGISGNPQITVSEDGKYLYELEVESPGRRCLNDVLRLRKTDGQGEISEETVFNGSCVEFSYTLSPDKKYIAFYSLDPSQNSTDFYVYDLNRKNFINMPESGRPGNIKLFWSGNGDKLAFYESSQVNYYDFKLSNKIPVKVLSPYILSWAPANRYLLFEDRSQARNSFLYDSFDQKVTPLSIGNIVEFAVYE